MPNIWDIFILNFTVYLNFKLNRAFRILSGNPTEEGERNVPGPCNGPVTQLGFTARSSSVFRLLQFSLLDSRTP